MAQSPTSTLSKKEQRQLLREEREKQEALEQANTATLVEYMVSQQRFVLEANMLSDRYGQNFSVSSNINFLAIDSIVAVIQIGNSMYIGSNGLGGVTIEGNVSGYEYEMNEKKGTYQVSYSIRSSMGSYDVLINIFRSGNADATVRGTFGGSIRYHGNLVSPAKSRIFKGSSRY